MQRNIWKFFCLVLFFRVVPVFLFVVFASSCSKKISEGSNLFAELSASKEESNIEALFIKITSPSVPVFFSNQDTLEITGQCFDTSIVSIEGDVLDSEVIAPEGKLSQVCTAQTFSFTITKTDDGNHDLVFKAKLPDTDIEVVTNFIWKRDTVAPGVPVLKNPAISPFLTGQTLTQITVGCEDQATVAIAGDESLEALCIGIEHKFDLTKSEDGIYNYAIFQTDRGENISGTANFQWIKDSTVPSQPTITHPSELPYYFNTSPTIISGTCVSGNTVMLEGDRTASVLCAVDNTFSFDVNESSEGTVNLTVSQIGLNMIKSPGAIVNLVFDTTLPDAPTINAPLENPFSSATPISISGVCETSALVKLFYFGGVLVDTASCVDALYNFTHDELIDGTYSFSVLQTDRAGNSSSFSDPNPVVWNRVTAIPPVPTITQPISNPYYSNTRTLIVTGGCENGDNVILEGDANNNVTCALLSYTFTINKPTGVNFNFSIKQSNAVNTSGAVNLQWVIDETPPDVSIDAMPADPNSDPEASFTFSSTDLGAVFECRLDGGIWSSCSSPHVYSDLINTTYLFEVRARDVAGNVTTTPPSYSWTQNVLFSTVALFHFDTGAEFEDSGNYTNDLVNNGASSGLTGKFSQGVGLVASESDFLSVPYSTSLSYVADTMTVETYVNFTSVPPKNGDRMVLASHSGVASDYGWVVGVKKQGGLKLFFEASIDGGGTLPSVQSGVVTLVAGTWYHIAFTWNKGAVNMYLDGALVGSNTIGVVGSETLNISSAAFMLGQNQLLDFLDGVLDEVRLSRIVRTVFPPAGAYSAD